jgi:hypothetical protein
MATNRLIVSRAKIKTCHRSGASSTRNQRSGASIPEDSSNPIPHPLIMGSGAQINRALTTAKPVQTNPANGFRGTAVSDEDDGSSFKGRSISGRWVYAPDGGAVFPGAPFLVIGRFFGSL